MNQNCIIFEISRIKSNGVLNCNKNPAIKDRTNVNARSERVNKFLRGYIHIVRNLASPSTIGFNLRLFNVVCLFIKSTCISFVYSIPL